MEGSEKCGSGKRRWREPPSGDAGREKRRSFRDRSAGQRLRAPSGSPLIHLRLELQGGAVGGVHLFDAALLVLDRDDLDIDLHRDGAEAFDELAELLDGGVGEGLRLKA